MHRKDKQILAKVAREGGVRQKQYTDWFWLILMATVIVLAALETQLPPWWFLLPLVIALAWLYGRLRRRQRLANEAANQAFAARLLFAEKLARDENLYLDLAYRMSAVADLLAGKTMVEKKVCHLQLMEDGQWVGAPQVRQAAQAGAAVVVCNTDFSAQAKAQAESLGVRLISRAQLTDWAEEMALLASEAELAAFATRERKKAAAKQGQGSLAAVFLWGTLLFALSLILEPFGAYYLAAVMLYAIGYYRLLERVLA